MALRKILLRLNVEALLEIEFTFLVRIARLVIISHWELFRLSIYNHAWVLLASIIINISEASLCSMVCIIVARKPSTWVAQYRLMSLNRRLLIPCIEWLLVWILSSLKRSENVLGLKVLLFSNSAVFFMPYSGLSVQTCWWNWNLPIVHELPSTVIISKVWCLIAQVLSWVIYVSSTVFQNTYALRWGSVLSLLNLQFHLLLDYLRLW